jgi:hypothetical protein
MQLLSHGQQRFALMLTPRTHPGDGVLLPPRIHPPRPFCYILVTKRAPDAGDSGAIFKHFSGFEFFLLPNIVHARPSASIPLGKITLGDDDANRWLASFQINAIKTVSKSV